jgi:hypothetical protein
VPESTEVPPEIVERVRSLCLALPETYEEAAWAGTRWCVRKKNFAQVVSIDNGWPPAYAQAAESDGPLVVLTFRSREAELNALHFTEAPFFKPVWFPDIAGVVLDERTDWDEVAELITESYCMLAPGKLTALLDHIPSDAQE